MTDIRSGCAYFTAEGTPTDKLLAIFRGDQQKLNLAWLVEPRLDKEGLECLRENPIANSIHEYMDATTREHLRQPPGTFMNYWRKLDNGELLITECFPDGYTETMESRALAWGVDYNNVVFVNFRKKA